MILSLGAIRRPRAEDLAIIKRTEQILRLLAHSSLGKKTVLDVGCGYGLYTLSIAQVAKRTIGIDTQEEPLREARKNRVKLNTSAEFIKATAEHLPLRDSCCDIVLVLEALEHIENQGGALKEANRISKRLGYLVVSVPNKLYPLEMHYVRIGRIEVRGFYGSVPFFSWVPRFIRKRFETARIYTQKEIIKIIEENGFVVCHVEYSVFPRLDRLGSKRITKFCDRFFTPLESNAFFKQFGMSIFVLAQKR